MKDAIKNIVQESIDVKKNLLESEHVVESIGKSIEIIVAALKVGNKILIFGNGGSAGDAQHFSGELVNRFKINRRALPAIALTTDTSIITSIGNDSGYDYIFSRQVEALGVRGDVAVAITTSDIENREGGHSADIANALVEAQKNGLKTIGLVSSKSRNILQLLDIAIAVPSENTPRIQESHIMIIHIICELLENAMFKDNGK